ncbi:tetratricopeptide repeat protein [Paenibacillus sp. HJGM_3]|uniref:tetratricopeptide repeat protein n=1 Tax=Paenibacillus sp. HJGM_3 TaxID=3379816 RepID=UPI0038587558
MSGNSNIKLAYQSILEHDFEQAIEWFQQAVLEEPDNAEFHYKLSITYARSNKLSPALMHAREAMRLDPTYRTHYNHLRARELVKKAGRRMEQGIGDLQSAAEMLKRAIQLDGLFLEAYLLLGVAYTGLRRYASAAETLKEALRLDPMREDARHLLQQLEQNELYSNR